MATISPTRMHGRPLSAGFGVGLLGRCFGALLEWDRRARERGHLLTLDDRALADLGLTRGDILREVEKHFWQR
jgi:uncharacterized protein YjiS (DUF1127 family)